MKDHLVMVAVDREDLDHGIYNVVWEDMENHGFAISGVDLEDLGRWQNQATQWLVEETDVEAMAKKLTANFPGKDIQVYKLTGIYYRVPGELQTKAVSKDGILPF